MSQIHREVSPEVTPQVTQSSAELPKGFFITEEQLVAGALFEYRVRAELGRHGDFPVPHETNKAKARPLQWRKDTVALRANKEATDQAKLDGSWVVRAAIMGPEGAGHRAMFTVFEKPELDIEPLVLLDAVILPRQHSLQRPEWFGIHPLQEGFSTRLSDIRFDTHSMAGKDGQRYLIPARHILADSLEIIPPPAGRNGSTSH